VGRRFDPIVSDGAAAASLSPLGERRVITTL
jgi:hypothetical protein